MLNRIVTLTNNYVDAMPKKERKKYGQFFTSMETACFMASLYAIPSGLTRVRLLDAGAGSGILTAALLERLNEIDSIEEIELTCYENDSNVLPLLKENMGYCKSFMKKKLLVNIIEDNYILSQQGHVPERYDFVIGNPPYMKISKDAPEALAMPNVCYGAPNLYFIFASMGLINLVDGGEMVYIIPRSWTSGAYFKRFRQFFLTEGRLEHIHLFDSRNDVFDKESVLQETIIIKVKRTQEKFDTVTISSSNANNFENITTLTVPYDLVVTGPESYVYLITSEREIDVLKKLHKFDKTLPEIGIRMKTGLTVDFRNRDVLRNEDEADAIPLFYAQHVKNGKVKFPIQKEYQYIVTDQKGLRQENKNYLFVKRFTSKEEARRLQCGVYLAEEFPQYKEISTQNKLNFVTGISFELSECIVYGLYVLFNSTLYDLYYRILNGSTQVNSTEINAMPVPDLEIIKKLGQDMMSNMDYSVSGCDKILEGYCCE